MFFGKIGSETAEAIGNSHRTDNECGAPQWIKTQELLPMGRKLTMRSRALTEADSYLIQEVAKELSVSLCKLLEHLKLKREGEKS